MVRGSQNNQHFTAPYYLFSSFPQSHLSSSSYPNSQHFLISLSGAWEESRRSGSRLMLTIAEQPRFGFPAPSRVSYVQLVFISLLLCGFSLKGFCSCLIVSAFKVFCSSHYILVHTGRERHSNRIFSPQKTH